MKIIIYQTSPVFMDIKTNLEDIIAKIEQGRKAGAKLIVFPELALTGYFIGHDYHRVALRLDSDEIKQIVAASKKTAVVVGFIEESPSMNFYNSALVAVDGKILFAYRKLNLPNYGVFEEKKYFSSGKKVPVFQLEDFNIALFICNDLWHPALPYLGICQKADIFVSIFNSSEGSMGSEFSNIESWGIINKFYSRIFGIYNIAANRVGEETYSEKRHLTEKSGQPRSPSTPDDHDGEIKEMKFHFWGGSEIINPFGQQIAKAKLHEVDEISANVERDLLRRKKILLPYLRSDDPYFTHRELERILYNT